MFHCNGIMMLLVRTITFALGTVKESKKKKSAAKPNKLAKRGEKILFSHAEQFYFQVT